MKKKVVVFVSLALVIVLSPRLFILTSATWDYYNTQTVCIGQRPTPPAELGEPSLLSIYEVTPYTVLTKDGYIYLGDEHIEYGETWFGAADLIWLNTNGATFLATIRSTSHPQIICRWFVPTGDYR